MEHYKPGLHFILDMDQADSVSLTNMNGCQNLIDDLILNLSLQKVGEVYHNFEGGGFTATVCLTESHIAIHTWPEYNRVTFDVFLSNFMHVNDAKGEKIVDALAAFFGNGAFTINKLRR